MQIRKMPINKKAVDKKAFKISSLIGILFGLLCGIGFSAQKYGELKLGNLLWWIFAISLAMICTLVLYIFLVASSKYAVGEKDTKRGGDSVNPEGRNMAYGRVIIFAIILLACWIPVFLAEYPGFFVYDATDEFVQVASRTFNTHHPLLHVLLLGGSVCGGNKVFGNYNAGIAIYTLFQMVVVSGIFGWIVALDCLDCKDRKSYRICMILHLIWYGLFPTVVMFVLCSAKDTLFSAFMMIAVVMTYRLVKEYYSGARLNRKNTIILAFALLIMMLMRHNGMYAVLFMAVSIMILVAVSSKNNGAKCKKVLLGILLFFASTILLYRLSDLGLRAITKADAAENQEILTVPIQQLARSWRPYQAEMSSNEREAIVHYIPEKALERYTPNLSDPVKADFNNKAFSENPGGFVKIWLKMFAKHPLSYINAWIDTSYGYYYPWTVVNVYEGHSVYTFTYDESSYFGYEVELPGERHSFIPVIDGIYRWLSLDDDIQRMPIAHLFFSMGALFWVYVAVMALLIYKKNWAAFISLMLPVGVWLTLLLGPTFLPRYTVFLWFLLPVGIKYAIQTFFSKEG